MPIPSPAERAAKEADERKPFWVRCEPCGHAWAAHYMPIPASIAAKLLRRPLCPNCGNGPKGVVVAKQADGVLLEAARAAGKEDV